MEENRSKAKKHHFVLVHGAGHGAWCWYKVVTLLESAGHDVTAIDLTASGTNPKQIEDVQTIHDYVQPLMEFMDSLPLGKRVVLVGHSYGGVVLALAMEAFPEKTSVAVFAAATVPGHQLSLVEAHAEFIKRSPPEALLGIEFFFDQGPNNPPTSSIMPHKMLSSWLYQNCSPEDLTLATMLVRQHRQFTDELLQDILFTKERFGSVSRVYIICKDDKLADEDFQRFMAERALVNELKEIEGSDHMVMLSKPRELFNYLLVVAEKYD